MSLTWTNLPDGNVRCVETGCVMSDAERAQHEASYHYKQAAHARAQRGVAPTADEMVDRAVSAANAAMNRVEELEKALKAKD